MLGNLSPLVPRPWSRAPSPRFLLVAIGCLGIATQLMLLRELMAAYGGNEFSAAVTVAVWILCEALGAWLAGRLRLSPPSSLLPVLSVFFSLASVPAAVLVRPVLGVLPGETLSIPLLLLATFAVVLLPAASHGALFVTAAAHRTQGIGSAYVWEGVGTVLAGLICFALFSRLPSMSLLGTFALPLVAAVGLGHGRARTRWTMWTLGLGVLASLVFAPPVERWAWGAAWSGQQVAGIANSSYGKIVRLQREGQQLILYDGLPVLTAPPTEIERIEELSLLPVLCHPAPQRVLVLGQDLAIPAALAHFRPDIRVITVQLDPVLARASFAAFSGEPSSTPPRFALVISDPAAFLRTTGDAFDCIILADAAPSSLGASRLFSFEFYRLCRSRLAPGGVLATAGPGNPTGPSPDVAALLSTRMATLRTAFENVLPVAADFPLFLASDESLEVPAESVLLRLSRLAYPPLLLDSGYVASLLDPFRQQALASALQLGKGKLEPGTSSAAHPRELLLNIVRQNRLVSPAFGAFYSRLGSLSPRPLLLLGAFLLVAGLVCARSGGRRSASVAHVGQCSRGFAILTSGFSGAAVSSLLIFAWQVRFGSVFSGIALLVTGFMLGTVLGGILGTRSAFRVHHSSLITRPFLISDLVLAACAAAVLALVRGGPAGFLVLTNCLAGACLGFQFAVAGFVAPRSSPIASAPESAARRAGVLTALDLVGGSLGGILTALVIVPVFGISAAALCAGAVKLASALVQLVPGRPVSQP